MRIFKYFLAHKVPSLGYDVKILKIHDNVDINMQNHAYK